METVSKSKLTETVSMFMEDIAMNDTVVPLAIPGALHGDIREAAAQTSLSQAEVMRQSIRIGLPHLRSALAAARIVPATTLLPALRPTGRRARRNP
jgi:hypothetical protein